MTPSRGDNEPPRARERPPVATGPWSQQDLNELHDLLRDFGTLKDMVEDYKNARWFRRQAKWWLLWGMGVPAASLAFWEPIDKLLKFIRGGH